MKAEREALVELALAQAVASEIARKLSREFDLSEARYCGWPQPAKQISVKASGTPTLT